MTPDGTGFTRSLTRTGVTFLSVAVALGVLGAMRSNSWLFVVALLSFASVAASTLWATRLDHITVRVRRPRTEHTGRDSTFHVSVHRDAAGPSHRLGLTPDGARTVVVAVGSGPAGAEDGADLVVRGATRGMFARLHLHAAALGPFGLTRVDRRTAMTLPRVVVPPPEPARIEPRPATDSHGEGERHRIDRTGTDVHGLRAWHPGDGAAVHWRSTVRRGTPIVVERETPRDTTVVVLLAGRPDAPGFDALLSRICGLAGSAAREDVSVVLLAEGVVVADGDVGTDTAQRWCAALPAALELPSRTTIEAAVAAAATGGQLVLARNSALPAAWVAGLAAALAPTDLVDDLVVGDDDPVASPPAAPPAIPPAPALRLAALASVLAGTLGLFLTGLTSGTQTAVVALGLGAATASWLLLPAAGPTRVARQGASAVAVVLALLPGVTDVGGADLGPTLAAALGWLVVAQSLGQATRRDIVVGLGLGAVLAVTAAGLAPGPAVLVPLLAAWAAMLVGRSMAVQEVLEEGADATLHPAGLRRDPALVPTVTAVLASAVIAFLVLPLGSAPVSGGSGGEASGRRSAPPDFTGGALDLGARGQLSDQPVFRVAAGGPTLWRATTLDTGTHGYWMATRVADSLLEADATGTIRLPADPADTGAPERVTASYEVRPETWQEPSVLAPGTATALSGQSSAYQYAPDAFEIGQPEPPPYTVVSTVREEIDALPADGAGGDRDEALWTDVPLETTDRTRALAARLTAGAGDRVAQVQAVESWLRDTIGYRLDAPVPPDGQDAVDFMLFESFEGFCQHFAAAEVVLLRSVGIPSRMATGYSLGSDQVDGWSVGRASDAHAWVEVWVPGHGWVTSDPTRGSALAGGGTTWSDRLAATVTSWFASDASRRALALVVALLAASVLLVVAWFRRRARSRVPLPRSRPAPAEPLAAFARLRDALGVRAAPLGPGDGLDRVRARVADDPAMGDALDVVERCLYGGTPVPTGVRLAASETLDRHTARMLAAADLEAAAAPASS